MDILRFITAGSVDNGKSTLIGRLLYDSQAILQDQLDELVRSSHGQGEGKINLAYLTDGLRAERQQGITIDVAYRFFSTPKRKFIIADTPGHFHFTRNMVTGASTAHLALILVDAKQGITDQTNRHVFIASLLGIKHLVICINKMDLCNYSQQVFDGIRNTSQQQYGNLKGLNLSHIPISALVGDNIVNRSSNIPWYLGPTLMEFLEQVNVSKANESQPLRMPIQLVGANRGTETRFMGRIASGTLRTGSHVRLLPSNIDVEIESIERAEKSTDFAQAYDSVSVSLVGSPYATRGFMLSDCKRTPMRANSAKAVLCWLAKTPLDMGTQYRLMHTTNETTCHITAISYQYNMHTLGKELPGESIGLNDIFHAHLLFGNELIFDPYAECKETGSIILIDTRTNETVAAGMLG